MDYTFEQLNDKEFEVLSADIMSAVFKKKVERFKPGKDEGIDGRFFSDKNKEIIIQCKHYKKTDFRRLVRDLKKTEVEKVKKLKPNKYIFVTSIPLSRKYKNEIKTIFKPYIKNASDVYGQEDLNDFLSQNSDIEERHYKLWITSSNVLNRILHSAIKGRSESELSRINKKSYKYVITENHYKAIKILEKKQVLLVSGEPGIGKTTLAENICLSYAGEGYEFICIEDDFYEAESVFKKGKKQVFYFDDFLGRNYLEVLEDKMDSLVMKFIERIKNDKSKYFILTSRTNILNNGLRLSCILSEKKFKKNEYMLTISKLTPFEKAYILYNHIFFSKLNETFIDEIYKNKNYKKIVGNKNFNPRLIEFITDVDLVHLTDSSEYWDFIKNTLDNPKDIWEHSFKIQSNDFVRNLVFLTVFNGGRIEESDLEEAYNKLNKSENLKNPSHTDKDFKSMVHLAIKFFLNRTNNGFTHDYVLFNPSITDYIINEYGNNTNKLINIFNALTTTSSLLRLSLFGFDYSCDFEESDIISSSNRKKIKNAVFNDAFHKREKSMNYLVEIATEFSSDPSKKKQIVSFLKDLILKPQEFNHIESLISLLSEHSDKLEEVEVSRFLLVCIDKMNLEPDDIKKCVDFFISLDIKESEFIPVLKKQLESFLAERLDLISMDSDINWLVKIIEGHKGAKEYNYDSLAIKDVLRQSLESDIKEYKFDIDIVRYLNIDLDSLIDEVDIEQTVEYSMENQGSDLSEERHSFISYDQEIDDLFERS